MLQQLYTAQQSFLSAYYEASQHALKLNNWLNTIFELNKFNRLEKEASNRLTEFVRLARTATTTLSGPDIFKQLVVSEAASLAAIAADNAKKAADKAADNKLRRGFQQYSAARKKLSDMAFEYSSIINTVASGRLIDVTTPKHTIGRNPDEEALDPVFPPDEIQKNGIDSRVVNIILIAIGALAVWFIFKKK